MIIKPTRTKDIKLPDPVIEFINRRFPKELDCNWCNGNCYFFAAILKARFPKGRIMYDVVDGHFLFNLNRKYYDFTGQVKNPEGHLRVSWDDFDNYDKYQKRCIQRDCIN